MEFHHLPYVGSFRFEHFTNHYAVDALFFRARLHFKAEWSGYKTTHYWRIRNWGFHEWIEDCVARYQNEDGFIPSDATPGETLVARIALALDHAKRRRAVE